MGVHASPSDRGCIWPRGQSPAEVLKEIFGLNQVPLNRSFFTLEGCHLSSGLVMVNVDPGTERRSDSPEDVASESMSTVINQAH